MPEETASYHPRLACPHNHAERRVYTIPIYQHRTEPFGLVQHLSVPLLDCFLSDLAPSSRRAPLGG